MPNEKSLQEQIDSICESGIAMAKGIEKLAEIVATISTVLGARITAVEHRLTVIEKWQRDEEASQIEQAEQIGPGDA